jgi:drug/metabolite transporter (DMT)-like permease
VVIAVHRGGEHLDAKIGEIVLRAGDTLLLEADNKFVNRHRNRQDFYYLNGLGSAERYRSAKAGIALAVLAAAGQGVGVVVAKGGMDAVPVLGATLLRLAAASLGLLAVGAFTGDVARFVGALRTPATLRAAVPAAIAGTYLAMVLMMAGVAWAPASIAALLLGTSPVFGLVVEAVADRTWPRPSAVVGTLVAVVGIAVLASG